MSSTQHSSEFTQALIPSIERPLNVLKNQILIKIHNLESRQHRLLFSDRTRTTTIRKQLTDNDLKKILTSLYHSVSENIMARIPDIYSNNFTNYKLRYTQSMVEDVENPERHKIIMLSEHNRAHRNAIENQQQIFQKLLFPSLGARMKDVVLNCSTCKIMKYDRHPNKTNLFSTPLPTHQNIHIDIFFYHKKDCINCTRYIFKIRCGQGNSIAQCRAH